MLKIKTLVVGQMKTNCYIIYNNSEDSAIVIDPGDDADYIIGQLNAVGSNPKEIIATHGHFDHNMAAYELQSAYNIPFLISDKDEFLLKKIPMSAKYFVNIKSVKVPKIDKFLKQEKKIEIYDNYFEILEIPGHTPGSVGLYNPIEKILFSGDTIFKDGSIGRYDYSYSNKNNLLKSINRILSLPADTVIYPGHGRETCVSNELIYHV